jgi:hypothetical protein
MLFKGLFFSSFKQITGGKNESFYKSFNKKFLSKIRLQSHNKIYLIFHKIDSL